jgi:hypothetical protein
VVDEQAIFGVATTRESERLAASLGALDGAPLEFQAVDDVPLGGVICGLPALLEIGLLRHSRDLFALSKGFYPLETIFLVLAFLALARVRSLEALRYQAPGEWGKLLGLDRLPEVKTIREKIAQLCRPEGRAARWSKLLAQDWMKARPESTGAFCIDGHVRVYHGELTALPRRYVSRQRLCLRGTTDYWVNALDGQPFFVVTQAVDPGLLQTLRQTIVPRLKAEAPHPLTEAQLAAHPRAHRWTLIFDREGYSPEFFKEMKEERVAVITYHKFPGPKWEAGEFTSQRVKLINGEQADLELAERGTRLSNGLWVREVRCRSGQDHQTSILATDYQGSLDRVAATMFARWCQENFFKYMQQEFSLDKLVEYGTEPLPETTRVINPSWRALDSQVRRELGLLTRQQAQWGGRSLSVEADVEESAQYQQDQGELLEKIKVQQQTIDTLKRQRKETSKHVQIKDLPKEQQFTQLKSVKKHFVDTIKLIAYRAETALVAIAREKLHRAEDTRAFMRQVFQSSVDLRPDQENKKLIVRVHRLTTVAHDHVLKHLCEELSATETIYPGTELTLVFEPVGSS